MALSPPPLLLLLPPLLMALLAWAATPPEPVPVPTLVPADPPLPTQSPDALFAAGAEAYARGDWPTVVLQMERALRARAAVRSRLVRCRLRCANATAGLAEGTEPQPDPVLRDLWFFRVLLRRAACLRNCGPAAPSRYRLGEELDREFGRRSPYNYLQVAYFKMNRPAQAAAAAHTFFVANPGHQEMRQNLEYYQAMVGVREDDFTDLEVKPHLSEFRLGVRFYTEEQPAAAILHLEKALEEYFVADTECRALCEGPYDYEGYNYLEYNADLFQAITDHSMQVLSCKQGCVTELASQPGQEKPLEDFLPSHFNYLQFAYYNNGNYEKAIECAKTYLLFFPHDEVMNQNLAYYTAVLGENLARPIQPREEIQVYHQRSLMEKELLFFSYDVFGIPFVDPDTWTPEEVIPKRLREKQKVERETAARISEEIGNLMKEIETLVEEKAKESADMSKFIREGGPLVYEGASVTMNSKALNGSQRVVVDGLLSAEECRELQRLTNLGQEGKVPLHSAYLYYNVTDKVRHMMESYFRLEVPLHFSYSHLVCRTAIDGGCRKLVPKLSLERRAAALLVASNRADGFMPYRISSLGGVLGWLLRETVPGGPWKCRGTSQQCFMPPKWPCTIHTPRGPDMPCSTLEKQEGRSDNSHEVHVDNCILNAEALVCVKEPPAYTFRDYSAILYLNGDFEGGAFYFTKLDAKTETAEVQPQCGRAVGFSSGSENPHGVKAVTKGQRCAIALWFTLDPRHSERERVQADDLVKMLFSMEEGDLEPEMEKESPAAIVVGKDEL
ncbi:prolyl 3-hydroxylase 1 isoform X2 [Aphelocoma coerulescens]|uniref:prolyl 3-hydroxylase 1 isoform X2 n=1 Tax=Aphelocoma coerulescens TaxID=39617 RepID=UPI0036052E5B